ncbi:DDB1- and CUL4-associated factor 11 [Ammospiza caudacuta]|uniref:DDB1- and CUL4-associated factor 11 n=1 Tax=Ammospiza caudacuta TaxID=2857398 RepID=UPI0027388A3C|nr:DDB1- and CUL4-associated factor 11 [Ammospiza caudacuta]
MTSPTSGLSPPSWERPIRRGQTRKWPNPEVLSGFSLMGGSSGGARGGRGLTGRGRGLEGRGRGRRGLGAGPELREILARPPREPSLDSSESEPEPEGAEPDPEGAEPELEGEEPEEEEEEEEEEGGGAPELTEGAPPPAGPALQELRAELGGGGAGAEPEQSLPRMIREREWGRSFSREERTQLSSHFLPNHAAALEPHPQKVFCALFDQWGRRLLTACQDHSLRLFEVSGEGLRLLRATRGRHVGWSVLDVAFSPDGSQALYCSWSSYVHAFDLHGEGDAHTALDFRPEDRRFAVFSLAVGPDGRDVMGGANDGCVYVYDRQAQRRVERVPAHEDDVNAVALADASGQLLLSGGDDAVGRAWDRRCLAEGPALTLAGHRDGLTFIHARGDGRYVVSNSKDQSAKLWDLRRPSGPAALAAARRAVARQSWDYRWQRAPRAARRATPLPGDASLVTFRGHAVLHTLLRCRLAPPGGAPALAAGSADGAVLVYDVITGRVLRRLANHGACVRDVSWSPEGAWLASASWDGTVRLWDYRGDDDGDDVMEGAEPRRKGAGPRRKGGGAW